MNSKSPFEWRDRDPVVAVQRADRRATQARKYVRSLTREDGSVDRYYPFPSLSQREADRALVAAKRQKLRRASI